MICLVAFVSVASIAGEAAKSWLTVANSVSSSGRCAS